MEKKINGDSAAFSAIIYTQIEGLNRIDANLIGVLPYILSGSARLVDASIAPLQKHHLVLWMNHGFVVRDIHIKRGYAVMAYAEQCAKTAIDALRYGSVGLPLEFINDFLRQNNLLNAYLKLNLHNYQV